ncbi:MAG: O-antigen ligase family protein [Candidatus Micrarchaeaceae archaeon]
MPSSPYGGGVAETVLHPIVAVAMILAIIGILLLPRKYAVVPFLLVVFLSPYGQELYIGGVHLFVVRILILTGWARIAWTKLSSKSEICTGGVTAVDKAFFLWAIFRASAGILLYRGASGAIIFQFGFLWDALGGFFLLRFLIQDEESIVRVIKTFAAVAAVLAVTMVNEKLHDQNIFGFLGGVSISPEIREGSIRAQGPFAHAILAGVFAATLLPFFLWLWQSKKARLAAIAGAIGCTIMVVTCASSTPLLAYMAVILGLCFWPLRKYMRMIRWGLVFLLIALALVMKAPVWFLIDHVDLVAGNSGYHRAMLIDTCIRHFSDWWLIGTNQAVNWGFDMWDMSNQFVAEAESGGLATLICFLLMISWSFGRIGRARKLVDGDRKQEWLLWFLGVALFSNIVAFFGISYFDQTKFLWFALFAMITVATAPILATKTVTEEQPVASLDCGGARWAPVPSPTSARGHTPYLRPWEVKR